MATTNPAARGSLIDGLASDLLLKRAPSNESTSDQLRNDQWIRQSFAVNTGDNGIVLLDRIDKINRSFSSASLKYTDSSIGGNTVLNPPPQFTRYSDIRDKGIRLDAVEASTNFEPKELGMGRYYSEALDDNMQQIHFQFGVAQYNSFTQFFTGFYTDDFFQKFLRLAGNIVGLALAPLMLIPMAIVFVGTAARYFLNWPSSKFYTMKPTMEMYWAAVNSMVNQIAINQGISPALDKAQTDQILGQEHKFNQSDYSMFAALLPNEFTKSGRIDIYAISTKAKRMQARYDYLRKERFENAVKSGNVVDDKAYFGVVKDSLVDEKTNTSRHPYASQDVSIENLIQRYFDKAAAISKFLNLGTPDSVEGDFKLAKDVTDKDIKKDADGNTIYEIKLPKAGILEHALANEGDGNQWVSFRVDYTGPVSESFSNSVAESTLASKLNSMSNSAREVRLNYGGLGKSVPGLDAAIGAVGTFVQGMAASIHVEGLAAFAGSAFVDIPKHWESSVANLPKSTYTMTLMSPYGNPVSQMFSIYVPLCALLAGALPLATGKQSHTSPFLCHLHDRGRSITRLGIIDSVSVTRGTSNLGWNNQGNPLAVEVSFSVLDLSSIVANLALVY
jgi:hypothetical protein